MRGRLLLALCKAHLSELGDTLLRNRHRAVTARGVRVRASVHSANKQADTGPSAPFSFSTYISTYITKLASTMREWRCMHITVREPWQLC